MTKKADGQGAVRGDAEFYVEQLKQRLQTEHKSSRTHTEMLLKNLKVRVEQAIKSLADGEPLDEHLIVNASSLTAQIARWNLVRDLVPYLDEVKEK